MTPKTTKNPSINANGTLRLKPGKDGRSITLDLLRTNSQRLLENLTRDIGMRGVDNQGNLVEGHTIVHASKKLVEFSLPEVLDRNKPLVLTINGKPITSVVFDGNRLAPTDRHAAYQLAICETRGMSNHLNPTDLLPYDRAPREGYDEKLHAPITDLHTHVSTQITAADLYELSLALDKNVDEENIQPGDISQYVTYPVELLKKLKVQPEPEQRTYKIPSYEFKPLKHENLECERGQPNDRRAERNYHEAIRLKDLTERQRRAVIQAMSAPQDATKSFQQVEEDIYRHTSPLIRNPHLTKPLLRRIAENYAAQGIQHAELATSSLMNPAWFEAMVEAVNEIEHGTKNPNGTRNKDAITVGPNKKPISMRFLIGLPRNYGPTDTMLALERTKFLAQHPYIVGVDLMGSETNKTSDFHWALSHMAMWARKSDNTRLNPNDGWNFKEDFIIRVHAGESAKNPRNVADAIQIAHEHKVRVRVGHAQNADLLDEDERKLKYMKANEGKRDQKTGEQNPQDWFTFEKCPDSNLFYRMKPLAHHVVIKPHSDMAHCVFGQDGNGLALTSPRQTVHAALATGMTLKEIAAIRRYEEDYISRMRARDVRKTGAFEKIYPEGIRQFAEAYRKLDPQTMIQKRFEGKIPFLIGGASDNSWKRLGGMTQKEINQMMELLVMMLNPKTIYFVLGRVESEGVMKALDRAIKNHNLAQSGNKFEVKARFGHASGEAPTGELAETISGFESIPGGINVVPDSQIDYVRRRNGKALFFDGAQFTASMLHDAMDELRGPVSYAVYIPEGNKLLGEMSQILQKSRIIDSASDLLKRIFRDVGTGCLFENVEERDRLISPEVSSTDDDSRNKLLDDALKRAKDSRASRISLARGKAAVAKP